MKVELGQMNSISEDDGDADGKGGEVNFSLGADDEEPKSEPNGTTNEAKTVDGIDLG